MRRARRASVLVVGDDVADMDAAPDFPSVLRVPDLFHAIGALATAPAARPIDLVVVGEAALPRGPSRAIEALRRADPIASIVRASCAGGASALPPAAGSDGFDGTIVGEITRSALRSFLSGAPAPRADPATPSPTPATHVPAPPPPAPLPRPDAPPTDRPAGAAPAAGPLGDVDLVDAVMGDPDGVARTAMALLREQTGWPDAELLPADRTVPPGAAAAPVPAGGGPALQLVTARAARREVARWAEWLAKWLALDGAYRAYRLMAFRDELTGTWNRRYLMDFLAGTIADARARRRTVTVMVFDIDNFKLFNDEFGHEAGDVILCETVALLHSVIRAGDRVCRIGGDEFAVVFGDPSEPRESGSTHPSSVAQIVRRFQEQVCRMRFPKLGIEAPGNLTISAGLAAFPWDGSDPESLLRLADRRALESKRRGKDHITFGPDAAGAER